MSGTVTRSGDTADDPASAGPKIRLGVSACLMGERVRYDGGHKQDRFLIHTLGRYVEWVHVCPEVEVGMTIPRPSVQLVGEVASPRMVDPKNDHDHTDAMNAWSREKSASLAALGLHGYVLKKGSPSCGLYRVRVYPEGGGAPQREGRGLFAAALVEHFPHLPVEEEGRLHDPRLRENFIERVFAYERWTALLQRDPTPAGLVAFHSRQKFAFLSHSEQHYRAMGRVVADVGSREWEDVATEYGALMTECMSVLATTKKHVNVLEHLAGFLKTHLDAEDKAEWRDVVTQYKSGLVPLIVPLTLLRHHFRRHDVHAWARDQVYLQPYPRELMLRNHV
jgi:uncharacterized protein YbgA (DUF1722 family)/uncharacterized protein YbbK (DUF523 family)